MADVLKTVVHSTVQVGVGVVVGGVCDASFPMAPKKREKLELPDLLWLTAEATLQIIANGLITTGVVKLLDKLDSSMSDPTGALAYTLSLQQAQPQLMAKLSLIGRHVSALISHAESAALEELNGELSLSRSELNRLRQK